MTWIKRFVAWLTGTAPAPPPPREVRSLQRFDGGEPTQESPPERKDKPREDL